MEPGLCRSIGPTSVRYKKYATSPVMAGAATEVPVLLWDPALPVPLAHCTEFPGALTVIAGPLGEKSDASPKISTHPTEMIGSFGEKNAGTLIWPAKFAGVQTKMTPYFSTYLRIRYFILMMEDLSIRGEPVCVLMTL